MTRRDRIDGLAASILLACCIAWGMNQVAIKVSLRGISPIFGAGLRSLVAGGLLWLWCGIRREPLWVRAGPWGYRLLLGSMFTAEFAAMYAGLHFTTASRSVIFFYSAPFIVALGAHYFVPGERLTPRHVLGLALAFAGLCLGFADAWHLPNRRALIGDLMQVGAGLMWGATTVLVKVRGSEHLSPHQTLFSQLVVSGILLGGLGLGLEARPIARPTLLVVGAFAYQAVLVAFVSYLIWFWLLARYPAARLAAFSFWAPLFGVMGGALFLGEVVTGYLQAAVILVAAGIYLVNRDVPEDARASDPVTRADRS